MKIEVAGYRGRIGSVEGILSELRKFRGTVQLLDARAVAGRDHALHGALHAVRAFERGNNISSDTGIEVCLRIAGMRQISRALELLGIREGEMEICAILVDCETDVQEFLDSRFQRDDRVLEPDEDYLRSLYGLGEEVKTVGVENALMERTTMLQVL
ncbi:KEOPS complex subunit Cgi121 [Methanothermobacter wolfeii]|uniref:KEOPS complex subunit Cgi121 n=1 Tax=Methanothermobacter wolfeii TaxID=145261 RepID=A0ABU8TUH3_METWO